MKFIEINKNRNYATLEELIYRSMRPVVVESPEAELLGPKCLAELLFTLPPLWDSYIDTSECYVLLAYRLVESTHVVILALLHAVVTSFVGNDIRPERGRELDCSFIWCIAAQTMTLSEGS